MKKPKSASESVSLTTTATSKIISKNSNFDKRKRRRNLTCKEGSNRKWVFSSRDFSGFKDKIVFISYNILGVENASKHQDLYLNVKPKYLEWDRRKKLICKEINRYNPSILCFQEVDRFEDLDTLLQKDGFRGVYQARTGEACDGCAIFWKEDRFTLVHEDNIEFKRFGLRDNVAQFCVLKMIRKESHAKKLKELPSRSLLVGNIHVLFNPSRGDIKLGQGTPCLFNPRMPGAVFLTVTAQNLVRLFLEKAHKLSQAWGSIPAIMAGDLNSMPKSAMYQFLASSELNIQQHERRNISGQICPLENPSFQYRNNFSSRFHMSVSRPLLHRWSEEELRLATGSRGLTHLSHNLKLSSAYRGIPGSHLTRDNLGEPLATSFHSRFMGTVDYIWHTEELVPVRVLETLPIGVLRKTGGLPSKRWGSDHLALVCELAFTDGGSPS